MLGSGIVLGEERARRVATSDAASLRARARLRWRGARPALTRRAHHPRRRRGKTMSASTFLAVADRPRVDRRCEVPVDEQECCPPPPAPATQAPPVDRDEDDEQEIEAGDRFPARRGSRSCAEHEREEREARATRRLRATPCRWRGHAERETPAVGAGARSPLLHCASR